MTDIDWDTPIWGAPAIGKEVNLTPTQTYWALEQGHLPGTKIGKKWVSTRRKLRAAVIGNEPADGKAA